MEPNNPKIFIGGISQATNEDSLLEYFQKYGEVKKSQVIKDRNTGFSRGFGFITFSDPSSAEKALQDQEHVILGRTVEVTVPRPKYDKHYCLNYQHINNSTEITGGSQINSSINPKKIFVGGLPSSLTSEEFKDYFGTFGKVTDSVIICDKEFNRSRGFGFVTFDSKEAVDNVLQRRPHQLNDKLVDVKNAISKEEMSTYVYNSFNIGDGLGSLGAGFPYGFVYGATNTYSYYSFPSYVPDYSQSYYQATPYAYVSPPPYGYETSPLSYAPYIRTDAYVNGKWIHEDVFNSYGASTSQIRSTPFTYHQRQSVRITTASSSSSSSNNSAQGQLVSPEELNGSSTLNQQGTNDNVRVSENTELDDKSKGCIGENVVALSINDALSEELDCSPIQNGINDVQLSENTTELVLEDNIGAQEENPRVE